MNKIEIELTDRELKDIKLVRNYFRENDKTTFEHPAFVVMDDLVKKMSVMRCSTELKCDQCGSKEISQRTISHASCRTCGNYFRTL